ATIFAVAIGVSVYGVVRTLLSRRPAAEPAARVDWRAGSGVGAAPAWTGPASVAVLVASMYVFTIAAFQLIQSLPIVAIGGGHGH
ncbi:MAG TPA: hypothetical protein VD860_17365, partial [Azospirillum sp.]|nr:hypothetical protein [Azospirillum sp.]